MATEPTNPIIRIAENNTTLPSTGLTNKLEPVTSVKQTGFDANILLSAENLNYILDNIGEWLQYNKDVADSQITAGDGLDTDTGTIGGGQTISLGTPSTLNAETVNAITSESHTHNIETVNTSEAKLGVDDNKLVTVAKVNDALDMVGMIVYGAASTQQSGRWLKANGAAISRTAYADLFAKIGTGFGSGDGSTTFNLPDLRGEFIRGWDDGRGVDSGRGFGSFQADELKSHTHQVLDSSVPGSDIGVFTYAERGSINDHGYNEVSKTGGTETRPRNIALIAWIRY